MENVRLIRRDFNRQEFILWEKCIWLCVGSELPRAERPAGLLCPLGWVPQGCRSPGRDPLISYLPCQVPLVVLLAHQWQFVLWECLLGFLLLNPSLTPAPDPPWHQSLAVS